MKVRIAGSGKTLDIDEAADLIQSGGEGSVYRLRASADRVAKIYHQPSPARLRKLEVMLRHPPTDPMTARRHVSIAWPRELLVSDDRAGTFRGFLMPRIDRADTVANVHHPQTRRRKHPSFDYRYLHRTAANIAVAVDALHRRGYVIGDINDQNILVNSQALVTLIDTDSMQVRDPERGEVYRCGVGRPEFTPPEVAGRDLCQLDRAVEHDLFGLAVIIFYLLMDGTHPFNGVPRDAGAASSLADRIAAGLFPFAPGETRIAVPPGAPSLDLIAPPLRKLFLFCFQDGRQHPGVRPSAATWNRALDVACHDLRPCRTNAVHWFGSHLAACPWCARATALGFDAFPRTASVTPGRPAARPVAAPRAASGGGGAATASKGSLVGRAVGILVAVAAALYLVGKGCPGDEARGAAPPRAHAATGTRR
jgi:DNA-binding helix-hairpin-helix protein with protein kinase domain